MSNLDWILQRIAELEAKNSPSWWATYKNIWMGSFDVVLTPQDEIDNVEIPKALMRQAEGLGLIKHETRKYPSGKYIATVWVLTELGKIRLQFGNNNWMEEGF